VERKGGGELHGFVLIVFVLVLVPVFVFLVVFYFMLSCPHFDLAWGIGRGSKISLRGEKLFFLPYLNLKISGFRGVGATKCAVCCCAVRCVAHCIQCGICGGGNNYGCDGKKAIR
jgi:hypothetical protein